MKKFETLEQAQTAFDEQVVALETAKKETEALVKDLKQANADLKEKDQIISEIRNAKGSANGVKSFSIKNKTYNIEAAEFHFAGKKYTADDVIGNKELQNVLISGKVGFIVEQE